MKWIFFKAPTTFASIVIISFMFKLPCCQKPKCVDLTISEYSIKPIPLVEGNQERVQFEIKNIGNLNAENIKVNWWAINDSAHPVSKTWNIEGIKAGESIKEDFTFTWYRIGGSKTIVSSKIDIDPDRTSNDCNYSNNVKVLDFPVLLADLTFVGWRFDPEPIIIGKPTNMIFDIVNEGELPVKNFQVFWFKDSNSAVPTKTWEVAKLDPQERKSFAYEYTWDTVTGQSVSTKLLIYRNANDIPSEKDYKNNEWIRTINVQAMRP